MIDEQQNLINKQFVNNNKEILDITSRLISLSESSNNRILEVTNRVIEQQKQIANLKLQVGLLWITFLAALSIINWMSHK